MNPLLPPTTGGYTIAVVTETSPPRKGGNMATALGQVYLTTDGHVTYKPLGVEAINLAVEVFTIGEILILDADGREPAGPGRKPSKWDVTLETFETLEEAVACAREITWGAPKQEETI